jgi:hypothetical protein
MDIGSIFLILALLIPVMIYIGRPLFERNLDSRTQGRQVISTLLAERDQLVASIQELDDDFNLGKVPTENYSTQRLSLLQKGAEVLRQIDTYQSTSTSMAPEERLEAVIQKRRQALDASHSFGRKNGNAVPPVPDDDLEQRIAIRRRTMQGKAGGFCPKCGKPVQNSDRFCPHCGATLS